MTPWKRNGLKARVHVWAKPSENQHKVFQIKIYGLYLNYLSKSQIKEITDPPWHGSDKSLSRVAATTYFKWFFSFSFSLFWWYSPFKLLHLYTLTIQSNVFRCGCFYSWLLSFNNNCRYNQPLSELLIKRHRLPGWINYKPQEMCFTGKDKGTN